MFESILYALNLILHTGLVIVVYLLLLMLIVAIVLAVKISVDALRSKHQPPPPAEHD